MGFGIQEDDASKLQPFFGQNAAPENTTDVFVSVQLDKLTKIDEENFLFEGVFQVYTPN